MNYSFQASKRYLAVARSMKQYEDDLYENWYEVVGSILPGLLKKTVLIKPPSSLVNSCHSLQHMESHSTGSRPQSKMMDYSYLLPAGEYSQGGFIIIEVV